MENKDELKEIDIKNCICYYLGDIKFQDRDIEFSDILLGKKSYKENYKNILVYNISYKTSTGAKPLRIRFNKTDGFVKTCNGFRCLVLFDYSYCDKICDKIRYLISNKKWYYKQYQS